MFRGYGGSGLARCWPWHPAAVADLLACWQAWRAAYVDPEARLTLGADWHDRYQPTTQRRLKAILGGCLDEVGGHEVDGQQCRIQLDQLATYARWWAGNRGRRLEPGELPPGVRIAGAAS